ncbi:UNC93-like protein 1-like isoform X1 [Hibiscus syriacus]|uniref:UNC93-like protein 1-like isoform X1 n=1 Tax=Hibiscus syriacus TaxID=106335 RepID=A0A6A3ADN7_HIBSY|nr:UNC93-like protein 1-like isoform X1 [Hibiscus syriacus]
MFFLGQNLLLESSRASAHQDEQYNGIKKDILPSQHDRPAPAAMIASQNSSDDEYYHRPQSPLGTMGFPSSFNLWFLVTKSCNYEQDLQESESPDAGAGSSKNLFDLLKEGDDADEDDSDQVSAADDETLTEKQEPPWLENTANSTSTTNNKSKKKKKKKGKESSSSTDKNGTPLDANLDALSLDFESSSHQSGLSRPLSENVKQTKPSVLFVDPKYLNVENELRRIFGSKVVKSFEKSNQSSSSRQLRGGRRGNHHIRKTVLISPSDHWPRWDGSLSMEFLETKDGYNYFRYTYSSSYDQAQRAFEAAQAIHDLNGVASVMMYHPYHLDSLLTMADYFRFVGEHQMSADAIAKCLYALECAWHPMFTPLQGNCQLKFNDPMGAMFCLDYFAVRAGEYVWLEQFSEDYRTDTSLWLLPNFSYSLAVCRFYLEQDESSDNTCADTAKASSADLMNQALMLHPTVLKKLVTKDFSDTVQTLPPDNLQNFMVDMRDGAHIGGQVGNPHAGGHVPELRDVANRNPLAVLFESLLPWVNYGGPEDGIVDENQVNEQGQGNQDQ